MTSAGGLTLKARGKVRDVYDLGERLLLVASDRISAFDCVLPTLIPGKGELLTRLSAFWFKTTASIAPNHMISCDLAEIQEALPSGVRLDPGAFGGRTMLVRKARRVDAECIVRGFLAGSAWKEYLARGSAGGRRLPPGLPEAARLEPAIFTPSTKADSGHDENISRERLAEMVGSSLAADLERLSLALFERARALCEARGLLLADTKFEFGIIGGRLTVIDEMLTPDSSRFWDRSAWSPGRSPESFDKQFVRDWLESSGWDKRPPAPELPPGVVAGTAERYLEAYRRLTA